MPLTRDFRIDDLALAYSARHVRERQETYVASETHWSRKHH